MSSIPNTENTTVAAIAAALELSAERSSSADTNYFDQRLEKFLIAFKAAVTVAHGTEKFDPQEVLKQAKARSFQG